jgi:hypothetical protein
MRRAVERTLVDLMEAIELSGTSSTNRLTDDNPTNDLDSQSTSKQSQIHDNQVQLDHDIDNIDIKFDQLNSDGGHFETNWDPFESGPTQKFFLTDDWPTFDQNPDNNHGIQTNVDFDLFIESKVRSHGPCHKPRVPTTIQIFPRSYFDGNKMRTVAGTLTVHTCIQEIQLKLIGKGETHDHKSILPQLANFQLENE